MHIQSKYLVYFQSYYKLQTELPDMSLMVKKKKEKRKHCNFSRLHSNAGVIWGLQEPGKYWILNFTDTLKQQFYNLKLLLTLSRHVQWRNRALTKISAHKPLHQMIPQIYSLTILCIIWWKDNQVSYKWSAGLFKNKEISMDACLKSAHFCSDNFYA